MGGSWWELAYRNPHKAGFYHVAGLLSPKGHYRTVLQVMGAVPEPNLPKSERDSKRSTASTNHLSIAETQSELPNDFADVHTHRVAWSLSPIIVGSLINGSNPIYGNT